MDTMSLTEESSILLPPPSPKKRKKKKQWKAVESNETYSENAVDDHSASPEPVNNSDSVAVRLKTRKKRKIDTDNFYTEESTAESDSTLVLNKISVNDNVDSVPIRMKKRKKTQPQLNEQIVDQSGDCDLKRHHKKVSFNDTVHSAPANFRKYKKSKLEGCDVKEHPPPKSILKHTDYPEYINGPVPKKKLKKIRKRKARNKKIHDAAKNKIEKVNEAPTTPISKEDKAAAYLETWKNDRSSWKFEKLTQTWLLKNMFSGTKVPEKTFLILLEYIMSIEGAAKTFATEACEAIVKAMEYNSLTDEKDENLEYSYNRARSLLQCLQE